MRTPSLYGEIQGDLKRIAKALFHVENGFLDGKWAEVKADIKAFADTCDGLVAEEKDRELREKRQEFSE